MPNVLVRDLPNDIHACLQRRAEASGKSLQQYLRGELERLATTPTMVDVLDRISGRRGGSVGFATAVLDLDEVRGSD